MKQSTVPKRASELNRRDEIRIEFELLAEEFFSLNIYFLGCWRASSIVNA